MRVSLTFALGAWLLAAPVASAQDPAAEGGEDWIGGNPLPDWARMSGDWNGARPLLLDHGIDLGARLTIDWSAPLAGGVRKRDSLRALLDIHANVDLEKLLELHGGKFRIDAYNVIGRNAQPDFGSLQGLSNIDATTEFQLAEVWYEQWLGDLLRARVGKIDANSEFAFAREGTDFISKVAQVPPTILAFPTYPDPATGIDLFVYPEPSLYAGIGFFDGALQNGIPTGSRGPKTFFGGDGNDDYFWIAEGGTTWLGGQAWGPGRFAAGGHHQTGHFTRFDGSDKHGTEGFYLLLEQKVWREDQDNDDDPQGIGVHLRLSHAHEEVSAARYHASMALDYRGLVPGRDQDNTGVLISWVDLSDDPSAGFTADETLVEVFHRFQVTRFLSITPVAHYVANPGGSATASELFVGTLRIEIDF